MCLTSLLPFVFNFPVFNFIGVKDKRYSTIKVLIETNNISQLSDIFDTLPKTVLAKDIGMNYGRFSRKAKELALFSLKEIYDIADLIEVDRKLFLDIIHSEANQAYKGENSK